MNIPTIPNQYPNDSYLDSRAFVVQQMLETLDASFNGASMAQNVTPFNLYLNRSRTTFTVGTVDVPSFEFVEGVWYYGYLSANGYQGYDGNTRFRLIGSGSNQFNFFDTTIPQTIGRVINAGLFSNIVAQTDTGGAGTVGGISYAFNGYKIYTI